MLVDTLHHVPVVPVSALRHGVQGDFVFVVQPDHTVRIAQVKLGPSDGQRTAILAGLQGGQTVVSEGADGLDDGSPVRLPRRQRRRQGIRQGRRSQAAGRGRRPVSVAETPEMPEASGPETLPGGPSRPFILRPVATTLLMIALLLAGFIAWEQLPLAALPQVDYPTIQVSTLYPGASPDVMALTVTSPLERQFGQMPGLTRMTSYSSSGASVITLQFSLGLSLDVAEQEVQASINAANSLLPSDLPAPPVYAKVNPADAPIISIAVASKTRPLGEVEGIVERQFSNKIAQISGVGLVRPGRRGSGRRCGSSPMCRRWPRAG